MLRRAPIIAATRALSSGGRLRRRSKGLPDHLESTVTQLFERCDADGSGRLEGAELQTLESELLRLGSDPELLRALVSALPSPVSLGSADLEYLLVGLRKHGNNDPAGALLAWLVHGGHQAPPTPNTLRGDSPSSPQRQGGAQAQRNRSRKKVVRIHLLAPWPTGRPAWKLRRSTS